MPDIPPTDTPPEIPSSTEWEEGYQRLRDIRDRILFELAQVGQANKYDHQIYPNIIKKLQEAGITSQGTLYSYAAGHVLLGSTPRQSESPYLDFPEELSLKKLLKAEIELLLQQDTYGRLHRLQLVLDDLQS